jgi:hypothetical protein
LRDAAESGSFRKPQKVSSAFALGFIVNYSPDEAVRYDLKGMPVIITPMSIALVDCFAGTLGRWLLDTLGFDELTDKIVITAVAAGGLGYFGRRFQPTGFP